MTATHVETPRSTWLTTWPAAPTSASAGIVISTADTTLVATYARPGNGVTRSWRAQPARRSVAIGTAWLIAAPIAP